MIVDFVLYEVDWKFHVIQKLDSLIKVFEAII